MAWTPGTGSRLREVLGSPELQTNPTTAGWSSGAKEVFSGTRDGTTGKIRQTDRSRGEQAGVAGRCCRNQRKRGQRKPEKQGALREG